MTLAVAAIVVVILGAVALYYFYDGMPRATAPEPVAKTSPAMSPGAKPTDTDFFQILTRTGLARPVVPETGATTRVRQLRPIDGMEIQGHTINTQARCRLTGRTLADCLCAKHKEM